MPHTARVACDGATRRGCRARRRHRPGGPRVAACAASARSCSTTHRSHGGSRASAASLPLGGARARRRGACAPPAEAGGTRARAHASAQSPPTARGAASGGGCRRALPPTPRAPRASRRTTAATRRRRAAGGRARPPPPRRRSGRGTGEAWWRCVGRGSCRSRRAPQPQGLRLRHALASIVRRAVHRLRAAFSKCPLRHRQHHRRPLRRRRHHRRRLWPARGAPLQRRLAARRSRR